MRTQTLNTYKVTVFYEVEVLAEHEGDAGPLALFDLAKQYEDGNIRNPLDMAYSVSLVDGVEPGQDD